MNNKDPFRPHVVIVGGGFAGLNLARSLGGKPFRVTVIDRRNTHLFQPLLYQVATGGLSPGDISAPLRGVLRMFSNVSVRMAEVRDIQPLERKVILSQGELDYDILVIAAGQQTSYFGNDGWKKHAPGLKSVDDALEMRRRILLAFEAAEQTADRDEQLAWLSFVVVGGGPTGVELAGALGEMAHGTLKDNFRRIDPSEARILLLEGAERILGQYPEPLSEDAVKRLGKLGVTVRTRTMVTSIDDGTIQLESDGHPETLPSRTVLWAAGVRPSPLAETIAHKTGAKCDQTGRIVVEEDLSVPGFPEVFVIGDLAYVEDANGDSLPGIAPVAIQQGKYLGRAFVARCKDRPAAPFRYLDKGSLAVIGRNAALARVGRFNLTGFPAWLIWIFVHVYYLIDFDNKLLVMMQWASNYITRKRGARLITGEDSYLEVGSPAGIERPSRSQAS